MDDIEFPFPGKGDSITISPYLPMSDSRPDVPSQWDFPPHPAREVGIQINGGRVHVTLVGQDRGAARR
jgi:hypothetical protein